MSSHDNSNTMKKSNPLEPGDGKQSLKPPQSKMEQLFRTAEAGDGVRSIKTTNVFRMLNFELYTKPNIVVMGIGITCFTGVLGYIAYMRYQYEKAGFYPAVQEDGKEVFKKKLSKWDT